MQVINLIWQWALLWVDNSYVISYSSWRDLSHTEQAWLPISFITEKPIVKSKMIKATEIELQTKNFRICQGQENKTPTENRTQEIYDQNTQFFFKLENSTF